MSEVWPWLLGAALACYGLKLAGMSVPDRVLRHPRVSLVADLLPIALLSALIAVQVLASDQTVVLDARLVGLGAAVVALVLRAPFLVVVVAAAAAAALVRLL
jgi:branched-subunit amino acid transport protein